MSSGDQNTEPPGEQALSAEPTSGPPAPRRLPVDAAAVRAEGRLRLLAAAMALPAALWLLAVGHGWLPWVLSLAALAFGALWIRRFRNLAADALDPSRNYLDITPEGVTVVEGGRVERVPWRHVGDISIDEDALTVCLARSDGPELRIEPRYGGLGLRELAETIYDYSQHAKACTAGQDG